MKKCIITFKNYKIEEKLLKEFLKQKQYFNINK